jgi:mono/diheme cytochrome c family protein
VLPPSRSRVQAGVSLPHPFAFPSIGWVCAIFIASATAIFVGCRPVPQLTPQEEAGKHLYQVRCAHCHEDNDLALKKVPPDLHGLFNKKTLPSGIPATDEAVKENVLKGRGMMPGFAGRFDQEQMAALLAYLHTGLR